MAPDEGGSGDTVAVIKLSSILIRVVLLACTVIAEAQQPAKIPRIGFLIASSASAQAPRLEAFKRGLAELGYVDGKNIILEIRSGEGGTPELLADAAAKLAAAKVDVIVSGGPTSTLAAKRSTKTIPIVMTFESDPVGDGLVASLARPGGNITGLSTLGPELSGKRLELLKEMIPKLSRVAVFETPRSRPNDKGQKDELAAAAKKLGLRLQVLELQNANDIEPAFHAAKKERAGAVSAQAVAVLLSQRRKVAELAIQGRLPAIYSREEFTDAGGLATYAASTSDLARRAATYVDKILKGAKPSELPIEQPMKFEFVINLKTAKQIGLEIPQWTLMKADRVIK
jgi:putative tryptophan/tyrosine transport system substrate-binding protein